MSLSLSASGYALPNIYNKPSVPPYLEAVMFLYFIFYFFFIHYFIEKFGVKKYTCHKVIKENKLHSHPS